MPRLRGSADLPAIQSSWNRPGLPATGGGSVTTSIDWTAVHNFVAALKLPAPLPEPGSCEWLAADEDTRINALIQAGSRWALEAVMSELQARRIDTKAAAVEVAQAADWSAVAKRVAERDRFLAENRHWAKRVVA